MDSKARFELRNENPNSFYTSSVTKSGIFTTTHNYQKETSEKSTIQHLPGMRHSKVDLSPQFVVVFQTIENERLSEQVQNLRVKLKDADRQLTNYLSYQVQIAELTQNCHQLEQDRTHYQNQLQKMSLACNALYQELSQAKKNHENQKENMALQYRQQMQLMSDENDELRRMLSELKGVLHNKQRQDEERQAKSKRISQQLVRLNNNLLNGQNELYGLRNENQMKSDELQRCMEQLRQLEGVINDEKNKSEATQRNARDLSNQNESLKNELGNLQRQKVRLENELGNIGSQIANKEQELNDNKSQIESYKQRLAREERDLNQAKNEIQQQRKLNDNIKNDIDNILGQVEMLKQELCHRDNQNGQLSKNNELLSKEIITVKTQLQNLVNYVNQLNERINQGIAQIQKCRDMITKYQQLLQEGLNRENQLEGRLAYLEPLIQENNKRIEQIFSLKEEISQKEDELADKESHINDLTFENKQLTNSGQSLKNQINLLGNQLQEFEETLINERGQFQKQKNRLNQQFEDLMNRQQQEKNEIKQELQKLKQEGLIHESTKTDLRNLKEQCQYQAEQIINLYRRLDVFPKILSKLKQNNKEHMETQRANENLRVQLTNSIALNEKLINQIGGQMQQIVDLQGQVWKTEEELRNVLDRNDEFFTNKSENTSQASSSFKRNSSSIVNEYTRPEPISTTYKTTLTTTNESTLPTQARSPYSSHSSKDHSPYINSRPSGSPYTSSYKPEDSSFSYTRKEEKFLSTDYGIKTRQFGGGHSTQRHSPYKDLPTSGHSTGNLEKTLPRKPSAGEFKAARGIKNDLMGGLAGMGREGVFQSTILDSGPIYESKRVLEPNLPPRPSDNTFSKTGVQSTSSHSSSYESFKRNFKG